MILGLFMNADLFSKAQTKLEQIYAHKLAEISEYQRRKNIFADETHEEPEVAEITQIASTSEGFSPSVTPRLSPSIDANATCD